LGVFPYLEVSPVRLGFLWLNPVRDLIVLGILVGYFTMLRRARRAGLDPNRAAALCAWALIPGFLVAHWFKLLYEPGLIRSDPWALVRIFNGSASFGGVIGGLMGAAIFFRRSRMSLGEVWRYLDVLAFSFLCGWIFGRLSCYLAHDHPGIPTASWLAVRYPEGPRYDLGLLEVLVTPFFLGLSLVVDRFHRPPGTYLGVLMVVCPAFRIWFDTLHEHPPRYWGISVDQYASFAFILAGLTVLRIVTRTSAPPRAVFDGRTLAQP
jgi:phosphatidylglycerol:prolipoprotein diacylglycerol transferase